MNTQQSIIPILDVCDNFRPHLSPEPLVPFLLAPNIRPALGLLRPPVVAALRADNGAFAGVLGGKRWRDEFWDVYRVPGGTLRADGRDPLTVLEAPGSGEPESASADGLGGYVFSVERAAAKLLGVVTFGVHMTVYEQKGGAGADDDVSAMRVWVPRRAATKPTYPGMLDNSVAGGVAGGTSVSDALVKEADEEAGLDPELVRKRARAVGSVSYFHQTEAGWLQPEVQFVYDLRLEPGEVWPAPMDGEVESFEFMFVDEIISHMHAGEFKPHCTPVLIDFLVRHGYLTPENEPRYLEINQRLHGQFDLEKW
ncbi:NUDIX hydrolase domain-like protein [Russula brevipes]|nr:NUDIX hydrolase domain-like protein [Russula brevipes]